MIYVYRCDNCNTNIVSDKHESKCPNCDKPIRKATHNEKTKLERQLWHSWKED